MLGCVSPPRGSLILRYLRGWEMLGCPTSCWRFQSQFWDQCWWVPVPPAFPLSRPPVRVTVQRCGQMDFSPPKQGNHRLRLQIFFTKLVCWSFLSHKFRPYGSDPNGNSVKLIDTGEEMGPKQSENSESSQSVGNRDINWR